MSGQGGFVNQVSDWAKHNLILSSLIDNNWPVHIATDKEQGILVYYFAYYLLPSFIEKISGGIVKASYFMLLWTLIGLLIVVKIWGDYIKIDKPWKYIVVLCGIIMFNTFMPLLYGVYASINPEDVNLAAKGIQRWLSVSYRVQFPSNNSLMMYVFPQAISGWILTPLFLKERKNIQNWFFIIAPSVLYSTFVFVGLAMLAGMYFVIDFMVSNNRKAYMKSMISIQNIAGWVLGVICTFFLSCSVLQDKHGYDEMSLSFMDYRHHWITLLMFILQWAIWVLLLYKRERRNSALILASIILFILPFLLYGNNNDLCMRASIPSFSIISLLVIKNILDNKNTRWYKSLLMSFLILCSLNEMNFLKTNLLTNGIKTDNYRLYKTDLAGATELEPRFKYQYVCWEEYPISYILKGQ